MQRLSYVNVRPLFSDQNDDGRLQKFVPKPSVTTTPGGGTIKRSTAPSCNDVVCARGRAYWDHPGNKIYRQCIALAKKSYCKAPNRLRKSIIVSEIVSAIYSSNGRFLKRVQGKGKGEGEGWVECEENFIREKVTQSLRDGLSFKYSSSTTRKKQRKAKVQDIFYGDIDRIVHSNIAVSQKIEDLKKQVQWANGPHGTDNEIHVSDETMMEIFDRANLDMLETIKKDRTMLEQLHRVTKTQKTVDDRQVSPSSTPGVMLSSSIPSLAWTPPSSYSYARKDALVTATKSAPPKFVQREKESSYDSDDIMSVDLDSTPGMFLDEIEEYI